MKVLVVVSAGMVPLDFDLEVEEACTVLRTVGLDPASFTFTSVRNWFQDAFPQAGSLDSWVWETVHGKNFATKEPHFNMFVYPPRVTVDLHGVLVGLEALRNGRLVMVRSIERGRFDRVEGFVQAEEGTWLIKVQEAA